MKARIKSMAVELQGGLLVTLALPQAYTEDIRKLAEEDVDVEITKYRNRRSREANALMWCICKEIGDSMLPPLPKEEVYRKAIKDVGDYEPLPIRNDAVDTFIRNWGAKGMGWFAEMIDDSKLPGYKLVFAYYGSSTYDTKQMSKLLDYLVDDAQQMGLVLRASNHDIEEAKRRWGDG
jgi:hypothetical protein